MATLEITKGALPVTDTTSNTPDEFYKGLYQFHEKRGTPIAHLPKVNGRIIDLHKLYCEVTERGGFQKVNIRDEWDEVVPVLGIREKCLNATAAIKHIYRRFLEKFERLTYFGEDPDKVEALEAGDGLDTSRSGRSRYPSLLHGSNNIASILNAVPMSYNYRQHIVNIERRRLNKLSTDLYKSSPFEKLMLSLLSPLPNEQDFAINVCTLMSNETKHTLKLNEFPKLLDVLLAHAGIYADYSLRKLFQHVYAEVRLHSPYSFWRDLLYDKPQILEIYTDEQVLREASLTDTNINSETIKGSISAKLEEYLNDDFLNLKRGEGTQDYIGQRVQQIVGILRNLSFFEENLNVFAKNRTFVRFIVMAANVRWGNIHIQALDAAGNIASELDLFDPTTDDLSRSLMATICDGIEGMDRAVILNCLEILYKICQKDSNEEYINKCLNFKFYETICLFLSLNDIMLLIYTLEAIYALTSMGARSCHLLMQVRGIVDQLVALITIEAQSYGPDGCILMRVVETVPGNMLPMVAQNIANLQNVATVKQQQQQPQSQQQQQTMPSQTVSTGNQVISTNIIHSQQQHQQPPKNEVIQPSVGVTANDTIQQQQTTQVIQYQSTQQQQVTTAVKEISNQNTGASPTIPATETPPISQNSSHEDEQYALAWLGATFERAGSIESHIEQQELYRMYLAHCQKSNKHSVVNHLQFPRLVRLIFNQSVGPIVARGSDGLDMPGYHYMGIRIRAQPLVIQGKLPLFSSSTVKQTINDNSSSVRKIKKKMKPQNIPQQEQSNEATNVGGNELSKQETQTKVNSSLALSESSQSNDNMPVNEQTVTMNENTDEQKTASATIIESTVICETTQQHQPSTSLIKSLLANKVNQRQQKQQHTTPTMATSTLQQQIAQPIKVPSTAISALVNNSLMQNTPVKVGQTTIKPLNPHHSIENKPIMESTPPPLAPLSGGNVTKDVNGRPILITTSAVNPMLVPTLDPSQIPATIIKRKSEEEAIVNPTLTPKRLALDETPVTPSKNAANLYAEIAASILEDEDMEEVPITTQVPTISTRTITEQVPMQRQIQQPVQQQIVRIQQPVATVPVSLSNPVQRQLVFHQTQGASIPQLRPNITASSSAQQLPTAMATIKTDQGLQTVPVILQQKSLDPHSSQIIGQAAPHISQQTTTQYVLATNPQGQTYLVAQQTPAAPPTPPPPPPPTQTVLFTQTPQQQSTGTKTIIILQQQTISGGATQSTVSTPQIITSGGGLGPQKMLMTTAQGQQVLVTQRPASTTGTAPTQQQIFINPQTGAATHIQHVPPVTTSLVATSTQQNPTFQRQIIQTTSMPQQQQQQLQHTGQISPTLLSQLNHIPATIKLHQPHPPQQHTPPQPATISRITKPVSILSGSLGTQQIQIPQLQQHQSIIQQHIVSGPSEKRQVIIGGGRAIEIKETLITPSQQQSLQQTQLNSQTIITTQPTQQQSGTILQSSIQQQQGSIIQSPISQQGSILQSSIQQQQGNIMQSSISQQGNILQSSIPQQGTIIQSALSQQQQHQQLQQKIIAVPIQQNQIIGSSTSSSQITHKISDSTTFIPATTINKPSAVIQTITSVGTIQAHGISNIKKAPATIIPSVTPTTPIIHQQQQPNKITPTILPKPSLSGPPPLAAVSSPHTVIASTGNLSSGNQLIRQHSVETIAAENKLVDNGAPTSTIITSAIDQKISSNPNTTITTSASQTPQHATLPHPTLPHPSLPTVVIPPIDPNWLYICDWRNCPRRKYRSLSDLQYHTATVHCPDYLEQSAEILCQWGPGPGLCDGIPRKRYCLMTHLFDRHLNEENLRAASQRRIATGTANVQPTQPPVTIMRNIDKTQKVNTASPSGSASSSSTASTSNNNTMGYAALHAIKRHTTDFTNAKELMDENEGPVTKSIRLTAALILRNLVTYTSTAKRSIRRYEPHLANIALSNVESSGALSHILAELNN